MATEPPPVVEAELVEPQAQPTENIPPVESAEQKAATAALEKRSVSYADGGIVLATMADALSFAKAVIDSRMAPKGYTRPSQILVAIQTGKELGLGMATSLRALYPAPGGQAQLYAEAALAICIKSGLLKDHYPQWSGSGESLECSYFVLRKGWSDYRSITYSIADARIARLVKSDSNWEKNPKAMVKARSLSAALHTYFADVILGVPIEGDLEGVADMTDPPAPPASAVKAAPAGGFTLIKDLAKESDATNDGIAAAGRPTVSTAGCDGNHAAPVCASPGCWRKDDEAPADSADAVAGATAAPPAQAPPEPVYYGVAPNRGDSGREEAAQATSPEAPPSSRGCDHAPAVEYRKRWPGNKPIVCEKCACLISVTAKGPVVLEEPPPAPKGQKKLL